MTNSFSDNLKNDRFIRFFAIFRMPFAAGRRLPQPGDGSHSLEAAPRLINLKLEASATHGIAAPALLWLEHPAQD